MVSGAFAEGVDRYNTFLSPCHDIIVSKKTAGILPELAVDTPGMDRPEADAKKGTESSGSWHVAF